MSQSLSIRFQPPEHLGGPTKDLLALLQQPVDHETSIRREEVVEPLALPPSPEQERMNVRTLRQRLRALEAVRASKTVDGTATWIITEGLSVNPDLGERIDGGIVGPGLGKGRIIYGPPNLCMASGRYMAIIECQLTNMLDNRWARVTGEVILNNRTYLSQQTKMITAKGAFVFRLPFHVREKDLLKHPSPAIEVRLNLKSVVGMKVTQVSVVSTPPGLRNLVAHPAAYLNSAGNAWFRWLVRRIATARK